MEDSPENAPSARWKPLLFPEKRRDLPWERGVRTAIRTAHIAAMAVFVGGHFFGVSPERLYPPLAWTVVTGALFMLLELYKSLDWLFQAMGLLTLGKLLLLALASVVREHRVGILLAVVVIASVNAHIPSEFRHYSVLTRRAGTERKG
jgi:hypothetical protein